MSIIHKGARYEYPEWNSDRDDIPAGSLLFLSDARGIYIPRDFAQSVDFADTDGISASDWETIAAGPGHEWYWEAWAAIEASGTVRSMHGTVYAIYQDGDCWLIPLREVAP